MRTSFFFRRSTKIPHRSSKSVCVNESAGRFTFLSGLPSTIFPEVTSFLPMESILFKVSFSEGVFSTLARSGTGVSLTIGVALREFLGGFF
jgi:hypothetical protein